MPINQNNWLADNLVLHYPFDDNVDPAFDDLIVDFRLVLETKTQAVKYRISVLTTTDLAAIPPWLDAEISPPGAPVLDWSDAIIDPPGPAAPGFFHALISSLLSGTIEIQEVVSANVVFTGTLLNAYIWTNGVGEWITFTSDTAEGSLNIVLDYQALLLYTGIVPPETTLIDSTVEGRAKNVRRMFIQNYPADNAKTVPPYGSFGGPTLLEPITHRVVLQGGYNTDVSQSVTDKSTRGDGAISISMNAGDGIGKFVICDEEGIKTINGSSPAVSGDMLLIPTGTLNYEITNPSYAYVPNSLRITNSSNPCCSCDDFITAYTALINEYNLARRIGFRLNKIRDLYNIIRDKIIQEKAAREIGLQIKTNIHIRPNRTIAIMTEVRNSSPNSLTGKTIVRFKLTGATAKLLNGSGILVTTSALRDTTQVDPAGGGNEYLLYLGTPLEAYSWLQFTFQVSFPSIGPITCNTSVDGYPLTDTSSIYVRNL